MTKFGVFRVNKAGKLIGNGYYSFQQDAFHAAENRSHHTDDPIVVVKVEEKRTTVANFTKGTRD